MRTKHVWIPTLVCAAFAGTADAQLLDRLKRKVNEAKSEVQDVRNDVDTVTHADEHVESAVNRAIPTQAQIENRAVAEVESTAPVRAVREVERDANAVLTADERAERELQRERAELERAVTLE